MKKALTQSALVDDATGELKTQDEWVAVEMPIDMSELSLPDEAKIEQTDVWYILYWIDQYHYLHPKIKDLVQQSPDKPVYFKSFSDSIGSLLDAEFIKDNSVVPVSDIGSNITGYTYNRVLDYIMTQKSVDLHNEMSIKTNNIFKLNMTYIKDDDNVPGMLSTDVHGRNLVTDSQHYERLSSALSDLESLIEQKLGDMYKVLQFIQSNVSDVDFFEWKHRIMTESSTYTVDMHGNQTAAAVIPPKLSKLSTVEIPTS